MYENHVTSAIIGCCIEIHRQTGPGLLESAYEAMLAYELSSRGMDVKTQVKVPLIYKGTCLEETAYRLDLLVENCVIVELKSVEKLAPVHFTQTLTYLRLANKRIALLINFNTKLVKEGIHRIINSTPTGKF
jgi:GxxExxY protein